jgi:hypothetical protein
VESLKDKDAYHSGLLGEVGLCNQVAGVSGQHDVTNLTLTTRTKFDHFVDINKMVFDRMSRNLTCCFGLGNHIQEIAPFAVTQ